MNIWLQCGLLFGTAVVTGAINSVAGGGSFLSFPMLLFVGVPPIQANATNTVSLVPGMLAASVGIEMSCAAQRLGACCGLCWRLEAWAGCWGR